MEVEELLQLFAERHSVAEKLSSDAFVKDELNSFLPMVANPAMWHSLEVGFLLSHASYSWNLRSSGSADPVGDFLKQLPTEVSTSLRTAYTDFGL